MEGDGAFALIVNMIGFRTQFVHLLHARDDSTRVVFYAADNDIVLLVKGCHLCLGEYLLHVQHVLQQHSLIAFRSRQHVVNHQVAQHTALYLQLH